MLLKKLTIFAASVIMTVPIVAAAAPPVETKQTLVQRAESYVNACRQGYVEHRFGKVDAKTAFDKVLMKFPVEQRGIVALICLGYGEGYEDGRRGVS